MEAMNNTIKQLAELAMEAELSSPIDWSVLDLTKEQAFLMMAKQVLEQINAVPENDRAVVAMATMTKLLVENFVNQQKIKILSEQNV